MDNPQVIAPNEDEDIIVHAIEVIDPENATRKQTWSLFAGQELLSSFDDEERTVARAIEVALEHGRPAWSHRKGYPLTPLQGPCPECDKGTMTMQSNVRVGRAPAKGVRQFGDLPEDVYGRAWKCDSCEYVVSLAPTR